MSEFAYVTDGACSEAEIMLKELVVMKSLNWELSPATSNCWLGIYMQLANALEERHITESKENKSAFEMKQFSSHTFMQAARLLDLCTLDVLSLRYPNSIIAAAAVYHTKGETIALKTSGRLIFFYKQKDLKNKSPVFGLFSETITGLIQIKILNRRRKLI